MVRQSHNPGYHAILSAFEGRTGVGGVLNTSFNLHGDPIVCDPDDGPVRVRKFGSRRNPA